MIKKFEFDVVWIERVIKCVTTVTYSFIHEGEIFGDEHSQRGIRQGVLYPLIHTYYVLKV